MNIEAQEDPAWRTEVVQAAPGCFHVNLGLRKERALQVQVASSRYTLNTSMPVLLLIQCTCINT